MIKFKNNNVRLIQEFGELSRYNMPLVELLNEAATFVTDVLKKDFIITMIYRTQQEQDEIYKNDPKYKIKKFKSPHQLWHSADIRSKIFADHEIKQIEDFINKNNKTNYYSWTAKNHKVGDGAFHFHIQYVKR